MGQDSCQKYTSSSTLCPIQLCVTLATYFYSLGAYTPSFLILQRVSASSTHSLDVYASALGICINLRIGYNTSALGTYLRGGACAHHLPSRMYAQHQRYNNCIHISRIVQAIQCFCRTFTGKKTRPINF